MDALDEVRAPCVVALTWTLKDTLGDTLDELADAVEFFVGGDDLLPKIEEALQGKQAGSVAELHLEPADAFGDFREQLLFLEPRSALPANLSEGDLVEAHTLPAGSTARQAGLDLLTVTDIYPDHVVLDGNHPLAGIALRLRVRVESIREASEAERKAKSAGPGFFQMKKQRAPLPDRPLH